MFQTFQLLDAALDVGAMRIVFVFQVAQLRLELGAQSVAGGEPSDRGRR